MGKKLTQPIENQLRFVVLPGFEPRQADPESDVLPLHHRTMAKPLSVLRLQKYAFFSLQQNFISIFCLKCDETIRYKAKKKPPTACFLSVGTVVLCHFCNKKTFFFADTIFIRTFA